MDEFYILFEKKVHRHANVFIHTYAFMECWIVFSDMKKTEKNVRRSLDKI